MFAIRAALASILSVNWCLWFQLSIFQRNPSFFLLIQRLNGRWPDLTLRAMDHTVVLDVKTLLESTFSLLTLRDLSLQSSVSFPESGATFTETSPFIDHLLSAPVNRIVHRFILDWEDYPTVVDRLSNFLSNPPIILALLDEIEAERDTVQFETYQYERPGSLSWYWYVVLPSNWWFIGEIMCRNFAGPSVVYCLTVVVSRIVLTNTGVSLSLPFSTIVDVFWLTHLRECLSLWLCKFDDFET